MLEPVASWRLAKSTLDLSSGVLMGVINVTPDSFSDGGLHIEPRAAVEHGRALTDEGAAIIDVGGESTRPGSASVSADEEVRRVLPVVEGLVELGITVSIDTSKLDVASAALEAGAQVVNDITACSAPGMVELIAHAGCGVVVMHMQGQPRDMQVDPQYDDVVGEVEGFLVERAESLVDAGVARECIAIDAGIGFGKRLEHNLALLAELPRLAGHGYPLVLGTSRKSFLGTLTSIEDPANRDGVTAVTTALGFASGARVFRVHDVAKSRQALEVASAIVAPQ